MSTPPVPRSPLPDIDALMAIMARFEAAKAASPALSGAEPGELMRHVAGKRAILSGQLDGQPAVFRFYLDQPGHAERDWDELQRIWPQMQDDDLRVSAPLAHLPEHGLIVVAHVPGTPLLQLLYQSGPDERAKWLDPAARWLRLYTESSETEVAAAQDGWVKRAERAAGQQAFNRLRRIEKPVLEELRRIAALLDGATWRHAIGHGDFHPNNLIADGARLTGIDCGGSGRAPIYKDMARFLMHMGRRGMVPSGDMQFGVDRQGIAAFARTFNLSAQERSLTLPFFLGVEALLRVETRAISDGRVRRARKMSEALLVDLQKVGR
jgi:hypothetical protein